MYINYLIPVLHLFLVAVPPALRAPKQAADGTEKTTSSLLYFCETWLKRYVSETRCENGMGVRISWKSRAVTTLTNLSLREALQLQLHFGAILIIIMYTQLAFSLVNQIAPTAAFR